MSKDAQSINSRVAETISFVLNAPLIAAITFIILIESIGSKSNTELMLAVTILFATIIPLVSIYVLAKSRVISDFYATKKETRVYPFFAAIISYFFGSVILLSIGADPRIVSLMLCYFVNTAIMMTINFRWKISIHASGISGPATALIYLSLGIPGSVLMLLILPIGWARITLKAHTLLQVLAGSLFTIVITYLQFVVYLTVL